MAKRQFLILALWGLSLPFYLLSFFIERCAPRSFLLDIDRCVSLAEKFGNSVPSVFVDALILAEDHRNSLHPGIDAIAIVRALWVRLSSGKTQGASTIEQQYVRVVTGRYERTKYRKVREQLLALILVRRVSKVHIASAYLAVAYYGTGFVGINGLRLKFGEDLDGISFLKAVEMVAQLKYPCPRSYSESWELKLSARVAALEMLSFRIGRLSSGRLFIF